MSEPSTIPVPTQGRLTAAHRGYAYQDLLTAYLAVIALCDEYRAIVVDRKVVNDDRFDDLEVDSGSRRVRRQIKHSGSAQARLDLATFNAASSSLRFDRLVRTFVDQGDDAADEYRLCATWRPPAAGDALLPLLESFDTPPTVSDTTGRRYRLRADDVWPVDQPPKFACLLPTVDASPVSRADVIRFCQRFVVELELPAASLDLDAPGTLERALLDALTARVGIGRYPNAERDVGDVAALAIHMAANARASGARLLPGEIARRLGVRTDFGRIAQAFPLDRAVLQPRVVQRERLRRAIESGGHHVLLAGPGAGKSWGLTQLAEDLADGGHVVARHYCFLDPGDELVERRVIADSFFGNLLGELNDALAGHGGLPPAGFAAGPVELERRLAEAAATGARIFLIIDGLDHIARVRAASVNLSEADTDIVEHLASLQLPTAVTLVLGSQPGDHLDPFRHAVGESLSCHEVTPWSATETLGLAQSHGLLAVFDDLQWHAPEARQAALDLLAERAEGNPLYARYLIRGLMAAMTKGHTVEPYDWLRDAPVIEGDIARYYRHLYTKASHDAKAVADLLGVLDFAVTARELTEITGPMLGEWVNEALGALAPILTQATAQGGIRIFHESFRRFMLTQLQDAGRQLSSVLNPAIRWLESRVFFDDARSYRFLFVLLRRAGRDPEILQHVTNSFVEDSLLGGHCEQAIEHNLWLACDTAARTLDWVALVRCGELLRSLASCFDDGANRWESYWHAFQAVHGPEAAAERLLFDGRPTLSRDEGLLVCASVDAAQTVAPWREYLNLPVEDDTERQTFDPGDTGDALVHDETVWLATLRGRLRLGERFRMMRRVHIHLCLGDDTLSAAFVRRVGRLFAEELSPALVARMARRADPAQPTVFSMPAAYACALLLGAADFFCIGNDEQTQAFASAALGYATTPEQAMRCVERGASISAARELAMDAATLMEGFEQRGIPDAQLVRRWFASVRLNADADDPVEYFAAQRKRITGAGWYPCWLRFALSVAEVEAARRAGKPVSCIPAFEELAVDTHPFAGSPRACDLFSIQKVINESLALGLSLLDTTKEWFAALSTVLGVRRETATRMDREDGGPLPASNLVAILATFTDRDDARPPIEDALDTLIGEMEASGTYYSGHAELHLLAATMRAGGPVAAPRAIEHWQRAAPFMLGYGFHKDPTLFDVIESVPALADHEPAHAVTALEALQLSVGAVLRHTDGRSTKGAPNAWFRALLAVDPVLAIDTLMRSYAMDPGVPGWWVGVALTDAIGALAGNADPRLIDALWATVLFDVEYENQSGEMAEQRLLPLRAMSSHASTEVCDRFIRLCAEVADDSRRHREGGLDVLQRFATQYNLPWIVPPAASAPSNTPRLRNTRATPPGPGWITRAPVFVPDARINELVVGIRSALNVVELDRDSVQALVLPLSYRVPDMLMRGEVTEAHRLLYLLARETPSWSRQSEHPLPLLAECLERSGDSDAAALAYTLAYTSVRGGGGWRTMGGLESSFLLDRAMQLNAGLAKATLAKEVAEKLRGGQYFGVSRHLVEQLARWGEAGAARATWWQAFAIINARLPLPGAALYFEPLVTADRPAWSNDEALAALLVARISDPGLNRKKAALGAFRRLVAVRPTLFTPALSRALSRDTCVSSLQLILQVLDELPLLPEDLICALSPLLHEHARGNSWAVASLARRLLGRAGQPEAARHRASCSERELAIRPWARALLELATRGDGLAALTELWPDLPEHLLRRLSHPASQAEATKEFFNERFELARGRSRDAVPRADVLSWPTELYVAAMDEVLARLIDTPSQHTGPRLDDDYALRWVLPRTGLHLALEASRVPRPARDPAQSARPGLGDLERLPHDASLYPEWIRAAWYETSFYRQDDKNYLEADHVAQAFAAAVYVPDGAVVPDKAAPMAPGLSDEWWDLPEPAAIIDINGPQPMRSDHIDDWLGQALLLIPPQLLRLTNELTPSPQGEALRWSDASGNPAVVMRTWRVRSNGYGVEAHALVGAEILIRPDLVEALADLGGVPLKQLCRAHISSLQST